MSSMSAPEDVASAIDGAIDVLRFEGWVQGAFVGRDWEGRRLGYCAMGALAKAIGGEELLDYLANDGNGTGTQSPLYWDALVEVTGAIEGCVCLSEWNDVPARTKEDVIDLMEKTSKDIRNRA